MNWNVRPTLLLNTLLLLFLLVGAAGHGIADAEDLEGEALVNALRQGGYNIYFRHAQTDWSQTDRIEQTGDWRSCDPAKVRQLSDTGRATARAIGEAIRRLNIPVGRVLASPYCRTVETAKLMGIGDVEATNDVMNMRSASYVGGREIVITSARRLLSTKPTTGTNTVIAAHGNVARAATPVYPGEAEGIVFRPEKDGEFTFVGRLTPSQWEELARKMAP